jgi:hypothetical protein
LTKFLKKIVLLNLAYDIAKNIGWFESAVAPCSAPIIPQPTPPFYWRRMFFPPCQPNKETTMKIESFLRHCSGNGLKEILPLRTTMNIQRVIAGVCLILFLGVTTNRANQYTISIVTGYNLIANELDHTNDMGQPDGNNLGLVMGGDNTIGCWLFKCDNAAGQYFKAFHGPAGWMPDLTLNPGEGAWLINPNPPFQLTFTGNPHTAAPVPAPWWGIYSCQDETLASPRSFTDITGGVAPTKNTQVLFWNGMGFSAHKYTGSVWTGGLAIPQGYAVVINGVTMPPYIVAASTANLQQYGGNLTLVWLNDGVLQQSTDLVTWNDVVDGSGVDVTSPYTVTIGAGSLFFRVRSL